MLKVIISGNEYECNYVEELKLSEETINQDLQRQASLFAFYSILFVKADGVLRTTESRLNNEVRDAFLAAGEKFSEKRIESTVFLDGEYITAKETCDVLKYISEAFKINKDMAITLAANMRKQCDPEFVTRSKEIGD